MTKSPDSTRAAALVLHHAGKTTREISAVVGVDRGTIARWVRDAGEQRRRGNRGRGDVSDIRIRELRYTHGWSIPQIVEATGLSRGAVRKRLDKIAREEYQASAASHLDN
jgi:DNA-directed RNA polymerase specialized sigma24 family protein